MLSRLRESWSRLGEGLSLGSVFTAAALALFYGPLWYWAAKKWLEPPRLYSHAPVVVALIGVLVLTSRRRYAQAPLGEGRRAIWLLVAALGFGSAVYFVPDKTWPLVTFFPALIGATWYIYGRDRAILIAGPLLMLLLITPFPAAVQAQLNTSLQLNCCDLAGAVSRNLFGADVDVEGTRFVISHGSEELDLRFQGSALRFMLLTTTFSVFLTALSQGERGRKLCLVAFSVVVGFGFNALRMASALVIGFYLGAHRVGPVLSYGIVPFFFLAAGFIVLIGHAMRVKVSGWREDPQL